MNSIVAFVLYLALGICITWIFEMFLKTNKTLRKKYWIRHKVIWGYHVHHSCYGLILFACAAVLLLFGESIIALNFFAIGCGIITMHTITDGRLIFIEREFPNMHAKR